MTLYYVFRLCDRRTYRAAMKQLAKESQLFREMWSNATGKSARELDRLALADLADDLSHPWVAQFIRNMMSTRRSDSYPERAKRAKAYKKRKALKK